MFTKIPRDLFTNSPRQASTAIIAGAAMFLVLLCVVFIVPPPRTAQAQVPDAGLQRDQMIAELRTASRKLDEIAALLREIRDSKGDEKKPAPTARPAPDVKPASSPQPSPTVKPAPPAKPARSRP